MSAPRGRPLPLRRGNPDDRPADARLEDEAGAEPARPVARRRRVDPPPELRRDRQVPAQPRARARRRRAPRRAAPRAQHDAARRRLRARAIRRATCPIPAMAQVTASLQRMLDAHDPYPGVVDRPAVEHPAGQRRGGVTDRRICPSRVLAPAPNVFRLCLHPDGLAARTVNFDEWAGYLVRQLRRTILLTGDAALARHRGGGARLSERGPARPPVPRGRPPTTNRSSCRSSSPPATRRCRSSRR